MHIDYVIEEIGNGSFAPMSHHLCFSRVTDNPFCYSVVTCLLQVFYSFVEVNHEQI